MGCGKSSVGKEVARILDLKFIDTDLEIEKRTGKKISEIFAENGELFFRDLETELCKELLNKDNMLISTGGGIVLRKENSDILRKNGLIFLLRASAETTFERIRHKKDRPLLQVENPMEKINELLEKREEFYKYAGDFEIITDGRDILDIAEEIRKIYLSN